MRINLRGGGDIASNPERERCIEITKRERFADMVARDVDAHIRHATAHGAGEAIPGPTRASGAEKVSGQGPPPQNPATGQEGGLNANVGAGIPFEKTLDHAFGTEEWRKLTQAGNCYPHPPKDGAYP